MFNFRVAIFVLREPDLVDLFFDVRMHHHLANTRTLPFLCLSCHRTLCEAGLGCCSEAVVLQAHNP